MSRNFLPFVDALEARQGPFSTTAFAQAAGISHPRASRVLHALVEQRVLIREGPSRRALYARCRKEHRPFPSSFWARMAELVPQVAYVPLQRLGSRFWLRKQASAVYAVYPARPFTLVDFTGIREVSVAFIDALVHDPLFAQSMSVQPLYPSENVSRILAQAAWRRDIAAGFPRELSEGDHNGY